MFKLFGFFKKKNKDKPSKQTAKAVEDKVPIKEQEIKKEIFNQDYNQVVEIISILDKKGGFTELTDDLKAILQTVGPENFKKSDLADFLKKAELFMTARIKDIELKKQELKKLEAQEFAVADIKRIGTLMSESPRKIDDMTLTLTDLMGKLEKLNESEDIVELCDEFSNAFKNLKDVSYALSFTAERCEMLLDGKSQSESLNFYSKRYSDLTNVYSDLQDKLRALKNSKADLEDRLIKYRNRVAKNKSGGLINLDWDGTKVAALKKIRDSLVEGFETFEAGCKFVNKNISKVLTNLISANVELKEYEKTLIPKLQNNVQIIEPKAKEFSEKKASLAKLIDKEHKDTKEAISLFNLLY